MIVTVQSTMKILIKSNEKNMGWLINGIVYNNDNELLLKLLLKHHHQHKDDVECKKPGAGRRISSTNSSKQTTLLDRDWCEAVDWEKTWERPLMSERSSESVLATSWFFIRMIFLQVCWLWKFIQLYTNYLCTFCLYFYNSLKNISLKWKALKNGNIF